MPEAKPQRQHRPRAGRPAERASAAPSATPVPSASAVALAELTGRPDDAPRLVSSGPRMPAPACSSATASSRCSRACWPTSTSTPRRSTTSPAGGDPQGRGRDPARRARRRRADPRPGQDRLRRAQLPGRTSPRAAAPRPTRPLLFSKFANAVIADGEPIVRPEGSRALDLEVELGVVIGSTAQRVPREEALDHVAGYVVVNDVSARDWQGIPAALAEGEVGDGQWLRAKGSDTFLPMGSVFVTADEIPDPQALRLRSWRIPGAGPDAGGRS